jgi:predicted negative regulator of RcsB-dependent stress response
MVRDLVLEYLTEQEQIELIKTWLKQYSLVVIAGIVLALAAVSGWRFWQQRQAKVLSHASSVYDEMLNARSQNNPTEAQIQANKLLKHYSRTTYGTMAVLMLARGDVVKKDYKSAEKHLMWVIDNGKNASFRQIARLRLARVYMSEHKADTAIDLLDTIDDKTFLGLIDEVKGDAYLALNKNDKARESYKQALSELPNAEVSRPLLQMKFDNLTTA